MAKSPLFFLFLYNFLIFNIIIYREKTGFLAKVSKKGKFSEECAKELSERSRPMFDTYKDARYNQDDILEWRACDRLGNEVLCYWNGRTELHIKAPCCECGAQLEYVDPNNFLWRCPVCGRVYEEGQILTPVVDEYEDIYNAGEIPLVQDYGEYVHTDSNCVCGISSDDYQSFLYGLMD